MGACSVFPSSAGVQATTLTKLHTGAGGSMRCSMQGRLASLGLTSLRMLAVGSFVGLAEPILLPPWREPEVSGHVRQSRLQVRLGRSENRQ
jgi:hypothetical protein